jgi:hypothetical protein
VFREAEMALPPVKLNQLENRTDDFGIISSRTARSGRNDRLRSTTTLARSWRRRAIETLGRRRLSLVKFICFWNGGPRWKIFLTTSSRTAPTALISRQESRDAQDVFRRRVRRSFADARKASSGRSKNGDGYLLLKSLFTSPRAAALFIDGPTRCGWRRRIRATASITAITSCRCTAIIVPTTWSGSACLTTPTAPCPALLLGGKMTGRGLEVGKKTLEFLDFAGVTGCTASAERMACAAANGLLRPTAGRRRGDGPHAHR